MRKILVVDDSDSARQVVRTALSSGNFEILEATDGIKGLEVLRSHPDIALVLCDVSMPNMTGIEMLAAVRREGFDTNIVMLTANGQRAQVNEARRHGVKAWINKPFKGELLREAVERAARPE